MTISKVDLAAMTLAELRNLEADVQAQIVETARAEEAAFVEMMTEEAKRRGLDIKSISLPRPDLPAPGKPGSQVKIRYQHPEDPEKIWSGRGKRPAWINALVEEHGSYEIAELSEERQFYRQK